MRNQSKLLWPLALAAALSCAREPVEEVRENNEPAPVEETVEPSFVKVLFSEQLMELVEDDLASGFLQTKSDGLNLLTEELGVESMERLFPFAGEYEPRTRKEGLHRWYKVRFSSDTPVTKAADALQLLDGVEAVEIPVRAKMLANDPYWANNLWGINNTHYPDYDVHCEEVWNSFCVGNPDVVVAVIDGGIQLDHPDLSWNCLSSGHANYVYGTTGITGHTHGTHVAGTIAAVTNNGTGVAGIAGGDYALGKRGISLLSLQCFKTVSGYDRSGDFETAMKEAADKGAIISQNSWGYNFDDNEDGKVTGDELEAAKYYHNNIGYTAIAKAIDYFVKYAGCDNNGNQLPDSPMKGGLVVFAAGNENIPYGPPANYEPCVAVGATTMSGKKASFSNYGSWVDICAPGYDIYSTYPTSTYAKASGTSMACPHVSGVAALVVSYFGGQGFTAENLKERLINGARDIGLSQGSSPIGPLVDAYGAYMTGSSATPDPISSFEAVPVGHNIKIDFQGNDAYGYMAVASTSRSAVSGVNLVQPDAGIISASLVVPDPAERGKAESLVISGLTPDTDYYVALASFTYNKVFSTLSEVVKIHTNENKIPTVETEYTGTYTFRHFETVDIPYVISDPDGDEITVDHQTDGRATLALEADGKWHFRLLCQLVRGPASFSSTITVLDGYGGKALRNFKYSVLANVAPVLVKEFPNLSLGGAGKTVTLPLGEYFHDEDGEPLEYKVTSFQPEVAKAALQEDGSVLITAVSNGVAEIRISATDTGGENVRADIVCVVRPAGETVTLLEGRVVSESLTILTADTPSPTTIRLISSTGAVVCSYSGTSCAFEPVVFDLRKAAPGVYTLHVDIDGAVTQYTIVKR